MHQTSREAYMILFHDSHLIFMVYQLLLMIMLTEKVISVHTKTNGPLKAHIG